MTKSTKLLEEKKASYFLDNPQKIKTLSDEAKRQVLYSCAYYDDAFFAKVICYRWTRDKHTEKPIPSPGFHKEIWELINKGLDTLVVVPRDHGKTTGISKIKTLKRLLYKQEKSILLIATKGLGEEIIGDIRRELEENLVLRFAFGEQVPTNTRKTDKTSKWRQRELQLLNGTEIKTITKGESVRGKRPTLVLIDDPQENKDVKNPVIADAFNNWIWTAVYNTLDPSGRMVVLGTMLSDNCFVNHLKQSAEQRKFAVIEYKAIMEGKPLWPEKWSMEALAKRREKIGERQFLQEYMNEPQILNGSPVFDPKIEYETLQPVRTQLGIDWYREPDGLTGFIGIDLASGNSGGDYQAIVVRDGDGKLIATYRAHVPQDALAGIVDIMVRSLRECLIVPENNMGLAFLNACRGYDWFNNIYRMEKWDNITKKRSEQMGWNTNAKTKIDMISYLHRQYRLNKAEMSEILLQEVRKYYYDDKGSMNAIAPYHDDMVIADALAWQGIKRGVNVGFVYETI